MNKPYSFPYGKTTQTASLPETCIQAVIESDLSSYRPPLGPEETVKYALANPHDTTELSVLAKSCKTVTVITSDHAQPDHYAASSTGNPKGQSGCTNYHSDCYRLSQKNYTERTDRTIW